MYGSNTLPPPTSTAVRCDITFVILIARVLQIIILYSSCLCARALMNVLSKRCSEFRGLLSCVVSHCLRVHHYCAALSSCERVNIVEACALVVEHRTTDQHLSKLPYTENDTESNGSNHFNSYEFTDGFGISFILYYSTRANQKTMWKPMTAITTAMDS